eukprot:g16521.t1
MAQSLHSWEVPDGEANPILHIPCLSSEEVITIYRYAISELVFNELSIVSCSYEGVLQHLQVSVSSEQIMCMLGLSVGDGYFNMFRMEAGEVQHCEAIRRLAV